MSFITKYSFLFLPLLFIVACKKNTAVKVNVYNYALDEAVPGAKVVLIERKEGGLFETDASCSEIASINCDVNGNCSFDREKLKTNSRYKYFLAIKEAYGVEISYPCGGKTSGFVDVGSSQSEILNADIFDGFVQVRYNNLLNPSQPGDSLIIGLSTIEYPNPKGGVVQGGGGVFGAFPHYNINDPPNNPPQILLPPIRIKAQRLRRYVRKHKLGVITVKIDTIKIYPNTTTIVEIDW